ncbi:hypothetical protein C8Q79DRAFT_1010866 [Trametes meyenii]|nr:hypothetical protein C8Q79DRAFT_1010866 [Trametes meyenii]
MHVQRSGSPVFNVDILYEIMHYFDDAVIGDGRTLAALARVSSQWRTPAQAALYKHLKVHVGDDSGEPIDTLDSIIYCDRRLNRTLTETPHLLRHIKNLSIHVWPERLTSQHEHLRGQLVLCNWHHSLSDDALRTVTLQVRNSPAPGASDTFNAHALRFPFVRAAPHLRFVLNPIRKRKTICDVLSFPNLEKLELLLSIRIDEDSFRNVATPKLRHLAVTLHWQLQKGIGRANRPFDTLIMAVGSQLRSLELCATYFSGSHVRNALSALFATPCPHLKHLGLYGYLITLVPLQAPEKHYSLPPGLDRLQSLETFSCSHSAYTPDVFEQLRRIPMLKVLTIAYSRRPFPYEDALLDFLRRKDGEHPAPARLALEASSEQLDVVQMERFYDVCRAAGMRLTLNDLDFAGRAA